MSQTNAQVARVVNINQLLQIRGMQTRVRIVLQERFPVLRLLHVHRVHQEKFLVQGLMNVLIV